MPFTISHAAAVLPLQKTRLPLAALMIGSMSPDFAYFLPGEPLRELTHSIAGIFWFCWPVSFALWFLFVRVLEQPTLALLPDRWHARFAPSDRELSLKTFALASAAVVLGAATHILWDSFTHRGTAVVDALPALHAVAFHVHGWRIRWFMVLQHLSSVFGLLALSDLGVETSADSPHSASAAVCLACDPHTRRRHSHRIVARPRDRELRAQLRNVVHAPAIPFRDRWNDGVGHRVVRDCHSSFTSNARLQRS